MLYEVITYRMKELEQPRTAGFGFGAINPAMAMMTLGLVVAGFALMKNNNINNK